MKSEQVICSVALLLPLLGACASTPEAGEHLGRTDQRFTSREAILLEFELDGRLIAGAVNISDPRPLIEAQLMYTVGELNGDRAVGRFERLEITNIDIHATAPDRSEVTYHASLPVAWGTSSIPTTYAVTVPARVGEEDQIRFATQYGTSCVDPSGSVDAGSMFLFYRPQRTGCNLDPNDVMTSAATVKVSAENTTGKYPEYDRIWEDGALEVVAMFSRADEGTNAVDEGVGAYDAFVQKAQGYLRSLQPNDAQRTMTVGTTDTPLQAKLGATLPDGRVVTIDVMLVGYRLSDDGASFDRWYDALTPAADLILYNGHAGLGENVRTLMTKGTFRPRQYAIWALNGCDTLAYVDRSLADRRALLNPDDPLGTKYMDTVSNVMAGYFESTAAMSMTFIEAIVAARSWKEPTQPRAAKTYQEIFASIDPEQVVVVTGEEDNVFQPATAQPSPADPAPVATVVSSRSPAAASSDAGPEHESGASCDAGGRGGSGDGTCGLFALLGLGAIGARRRLRTSPHSTGSFATAPQSWKRIARAVVLRRKVVVGDCPTVQPGPPFRRRWSLHSQ